MKWLIEIGKTIALAIVMLTIIVVMAVCAGAIDAYFYCNSKFRSAMEWKTS